MRRIHIATLSALLQSGGISPTWLVVGVLVVLFLLVAVIVIAVVVFLLMRRRSKAQSVLRPASGLASSALAPSPAAGMAKSEAARPAPPVYTPTPALSKPSAPSPAPRVEPVFAGENAPTVDLSRTVAITPDDDTAAISYGSIKFISGALAGEQFELKPEGSCIGRDNTLSQIVIPDPRISKRHVWIGVRDERVMIVDQDSRNGTFVNDPKSPRVKEVALKPGDTVILGESDVARFEYQI